jgi:nicotinate-nucleotide pyrophosphorylase (carboxylating)
VASLTRCFVEQVKHTKTKILDTRKTTPGMRLFEKAAVRHGGGQNHRLNLHDGILIKENHIRFAGGLTAAVKSVRANSPNRGRTQVEVETRTLDEVREAVDLKVWRILLDNMNNEQMRAALDIIGGRIQTEASGNMTIERVKSVAELGVDFISVGALTHSAPCADLSLMIEE